MPTTNPHPAGRAEPGVPVIKQINWRGLPTLYLKEVRRFFKVQLQTIWAPAVNMLLFLMIFTVGLRREGQVYLGVPFADFLAPGLVISGMMQNAFANSSSSILVAKVQGTIIDSLMPPLSAGELLVAWVGGAVTRAWMLGLITLGAIVLWPGVHVAMPNVLAAFYFGTVSAIILGVLGVLTGIWAEKFDHAAAITNFVIQPLTLLSGTFYTLSVLAEPWATLARLNPFFHAIDGFRFAFLGRADGDPLLGGLILLALALGLWLLAWRTLASGWRLKA